MKQDRNIHIISTDKPSRLHLESNGLKLSRLQNTLVAQNIYITSDEEIKEGDYCVDGNDIYGPYEDGDIATNKFIKIILTTDSQLIRYGVQAIDDEFLEWFVKNPSCEEVYTSIMKTKPRGSNDEWKTEYKIIIPKEEPKQETLEEAAFNFTAGKPVKEVYSRMDFVKGAKFGAKWQADRMYSEEEVLELIWKYETRKTSMVGYGNVKKWFEQFKKEISDGKR